MAERQEVISSSPGRSVERPDVPETAGDGSIVFAPSHNRHAGGSQRLLSFRLRGTQLCWEELIYWRSKFWLYLATYMLSPLLRPPNCCAPR